jgi:hypothetical protein
MYMQKVMLVLLLFFGTHAIAQDNDEIEFPVDEETGLAKYEGVNAVKDATGDVIFDRAIKWIHKFYINPTRVIKTQDKEKGTIEGKARFALDGLDKKGNVVKNVGAVAYTFKIRIREGRYKYEITRIRYETQSYYDVTKWYDKSQTGYKEALYKSYIAQTLKYMDDMLDSMEEAVATAEKVKSDDW